MSLYYAAFLAGLIGSAILVFRKCDMRDVIGATGYLILIAFIDAFNRIGATEYVAAGVLHFLFGATLIVLSTRLVGVIQGVISFAIAILCGLAMLGIIPVERGQGIAFNIYHWGMTLQWVQVIVFGLLGAGYGRLDREYA